MDVNPVYWNMPIIPFTYHCVYVHSISNSNRVYQLKNISANPNSNNPNSQMHTVIPNQHLYHTSRQRPYPTSRLLPTFPIPISLQLLFNILYLAILALQRFLHIKIRLSLLSHTLLLYVPLDAFVHLLEVVLAESVSSLLVYRTARSWTCPQCAK